MTLISTIAITEPTNGHVPSFRPTVTPPSSGQQSRTEIDHHKMLSFYHGWGLYRKPCIHLLTIKHTPLCIKVVTALHELRVWTMSEQRHRPHPRNDAAAVAIAHNLLASNTSLFKQAESGEQRRAG